MQLSQHEKAIHTSTVCFRHLDDLMLQNMSTTKTLSCTLSHFCRRGAVLQNNTSSIENSGELGVQAKWENLQKIQIICIFCKFSHLAWTPTSLEAAFHYWEHDSNAFRKGAHNFHNMSS